MSDLEDIQLELLKIIPDIKRHCTIYPDGIKIDFSFVFSISIEFEKLIKNHFQLGLFRLFIYSDRICFYGESYLDNGEYYRNCEIRLPNPYFFEQVKLCLS